MSGQPDERLLGPSDVHVYAAEVDAEAAERGRALLSGAERERADRFHFERDRVLFTVAHAALRRVLAGYTGREPAELAFTADAFGRPSLEPSRGVHFSLSHSGDRALIAVARVARVGVDVEMVRELETLERLAERNFAAAELADLSARHGAERRRAFFRIWTRKEAYIKALGKGLSHPLAAFDVSAGDPARFLAFRDGSSLPAWTLQDLDLGEPRAAALAVELKDARVRLVPL